MVVLRGEQLVIARGFGHADLATETPARADTVYPLGSISKQFTAAGVLKLVEAGKLALADPVARHAPEYWAHGDGATLERLLRHASGVREFFSIPAAAPLNDDPRHGIDELMALVAREPLVFEPGARWSYSNSGYHLLARVIEKTTDQPYEQFLEASFFRPLGLASLHHCKQAPKLPREATGYGRRQGRLAVAPWENMNLARGDGGLCGNAADVARWLRRLVRGSVVSRASFEHMSDPSPIAGGGVAAYGMGLVLLPLEGRQRIGHNGAIGGFSAAAAYYPNDDLSIAVLTNLAGVPADAIEHAIARAVLGLPPPRLVDLPVPEAVRERILGAWEVGIPGLRIEIGERGRRLHAMMPPPAWRSQLRYQGQGRFASVTAPDAQYMLLADGDEALIVRMGGMHWFARRVPKNGKQ